MAEQSFMKALFFGSIADELVFPFPEVPVGERDALRQRLDALRKLFAASVDSAAIDEGAAVPADVIEALKQQRLFGMRIPAAHGGLGLSSVACARLIEELGGLDPAVALLVCAHVGAGTAGLLRFGNEEQKRRYLPAMASGECLSAYALTEPSAGSDSGAITTRATPAPGGGFTLSGRKVWVTGGEVAGLFTVFARTSAPEEGNKPRTTALLVERGRGVTVGKGVRTLGMRGAPTGPVQFDDVHVPEANVLGEVGKGFKVAVEIADDARVLLAALCVGAAKRLLRGAIERSRERKAFGRVIGEFGLIKEALSEMLAETYAAECATYLSAGLIDERVGDYSLEASLSKIAASETLCRVADRCMKLAGAAGYSAELPVERYVRDSRATLTYLGTNEILRCFVALSGMAGPGRELSDVGKAMREPIKGFGSLSDFALRKARSAFGRERMSRVHPLLSREAVIFEEHAQELARASAKVLRKHGTNVAEMQLAQRRVADLARELYCIAACVSRTSRAIERRGEEGARREIDMTQIFVSAAQRRMEDTERELERNEDELKKAVAARAYTDGRYPFDVL